MAQSMTAFARMQTQGPWGEATWEIRSVNHRYLEVYFKVPERFRAFEAAWREEVRQHLQRGKVECYLTYTPSSKEAQTLQINEGLVKELASLSQKIAALTQTPSQLRTADLLKWPDVLLPIDNKDTLQTPINLLLKDALLQLNDNRTREGEGCILAIQQRIEAIKGLTEKAKERLPLVENQFREKLTQRLGDLKSEIDPQRFEQEVLLFLNKIDVAEELDRLQIHLNEVRRTLTQKDAIGRRLDFLMQELNREANTLASKSPDVLLTQAAVEIKVMIEQMREQIQNLE